MAIYNDINYYLNTYAKDIKLETDKNAIRNSIRNIVTIPSLPGFPDFSLEIEDVLFDLNDSLTYSYIEKILKEALKIREPRILVNSVKISSNADDGQIIATINYEILQLAEIDTFSIILKD